MRGEDERSGSLFSYADLKARVGQDHPLRAIRSLVNEALAALVSDFSALYSPIGRPSIRIPPREAALFSERFPAKHLALRLAVRSVDGNRHQHPTSRAPVF